LLLQEPVGGEDAARPEDASAASQQHSPEGEAADPEAACSGGCIAEDVLAAVDEEDCESPFFKGPGMGGGGGGNGGAGRAGGSNGSDDGSE
jgi:hypothetical protein